MSKMPSTERSEAPGGVPGILVKTHATLKGRFRWQVLDEHGNPEQPVGPDGKPIAYSGGWQDNLITNLGLNAIGTINLTQPHTTASTGNGWRSYLAVGTGSSAPDFTDAALDSEVQRANTNGALANPVVTLDTGDDVVRSTQLRDVQVTMNADRNLTEWGLSHEASVGVNIRELFRDDLGDPITISLLNGKTLRLQHVLIVEIAAPAAGTADAFNIAEFDAANNPVGSTPYDLIKGPTGAVNSVMTVWHPVGVAWVSTGTSVTYVRRLTSGSYNRVTMVTGTGQTTTMAWEAYVGDSHQRLRRRTLPAAATEYNGVWNGIGFYVGIDGGFAFVFDDPATFTKVNTHTLRVGFISTWARA